MLLLDRQNTMQNGEYVMRQQYGRRGPRGCTGSQVEYESTPRCCCKTTLCIQHCINKSALCQIWEAIITICSGMAELQPSVGVWNWCETLSTPIKNFWRDSPAGGEKKKKKVNDKRLGKQVLLTMIKETAFVYFRREEMEMGCRKLSYT